MVVVVKASLARRLDVSFSIQSLFDKLPKTVEVDCGSQQQPAMTTMRTALNLP